MEGHRPLLVEVQALTVPVPPGTPARRNAQGLDGGRLALLLAVLERRAGLRVGDQDVYASTVGGVRLVEPGIDLAVAVAVASAAHRPADRRRPTSWSARSASAARCARSPTPSAASARRRASGSAGRSCRRRRRRATDIELVRVRTVGEACWRSASGRRAGARPERSGPAPRIRRMANRYRGANDEMRNALARVSPGTPLRDGIDRVVRAKAGALLVLDDGPEVLAICSGGFLVDAPYSPQRLSELAKMDGAIIISTDGSRIARANVHLVPDPTVPDERDRHPPPHGRARRPLAEGAGGLGQRGDGRHQRLRRRLQAPAAGHRPPARPGQPGAADARALQGPPRRRHRQPHGRRAGGRRVAARRRRRRAARRDGAPHQRRDRDDDHRARRRRPPAAAAARRAVRRHRRRARPRRRRLPAGRAHRRRHPGRDVAAQRRRGARPARRRRARCTARATTATSSRRSRRRACGCCTASTACRPSRPPRSPTTSAAWPSCSGRRSTT